MNDSLQSALKKLRLSGLIETLDVRLQEASGNHLNHAEFLELVLQDELAIRSDRLVARRVKAATFREQKTLEDFDWQFNPSVKKKQIFDLATCQFIHQGKDVLLLMDSLTRLAAAQRLIGLASGEPPTTKGYTPSVFNILPQLLERSGRTERGSITGFYTVLVEGDDLSEPVSDAVRAVTDGHIYLSRRLANRGQYPAVDILQSVSRVMMDVADDEHRQTARELQRVVAMHADIEELVNVGAYKMGANAEYDQAVRAMPFIQRFLAQGMHERAEFQDTRLALKSLRQQIRSLGRSQS